MSKEKTKMARLYADDLAPVEALHRKMLKAWDKKKEGAKPWIADAFRDYCRAHRIKLKGE